MTQEINYQTSDSIAELSFKLDLHLYDKHKRKDSIIKSSGNCLNHESISLRNKETYFLSFLLYRFLLLQDRQSVSTTSERKCKHATHAALRMHMSLCAACACNFFIIFLFIIIIFLMLIRLF